jgi:hypothetical protein
MNPVMWATGLATVTLVGTLSCLELGYRWGHYSIAKTPELAHEGIGAVEAAVFALLGLLLGFSFAGATSRLDSRRHLIVEEANAIGTAYLRLDLLPLSSQSELRQLFRRYLDARLSAYARLPDASAAAEELERAAQVQQEIWSGAVTVTREDSSKESGRLLLPAINEMIDITTARTIALQTHLPGLIVGLLVCVALLSGLLAGYAMAKRMSRSWLHMLLYSTVLAVTIYAVLDLDHPRFGLIRLDAADRALVQLRDSIK